MNVRNICLATLLVATIGVVSVNSARILAVYTFPGKSHFMMHNALVKELVERGHHVTMITAFTLAPLKLGENYTEILIEPVYDFWADVQAVLKTDNLFDTAKMGMFDFLEMLRVLGLATTEHALKQPKVQAIINAERTENVYDLLLAEQFYQEAFLVLALKYNIPVITSTTLGFENYMSQQMGTVTPWSFVPHGFLPFTDHMDFWDRLMNSFYSLYEDMDREFHYFPQMDALTQKYFSHLPIHIPKVTDMEKNISLLLLNSHAPLTSPRPVVNTMISVGGMHIYPPKALPQDIKTFLDGATDGAIYFSLGSNVQSKDMPPEFLKIFLDTFAALKQRILWKFENDSIKNLPKNVMIKKWLPQSDILAHRNVKVFITHGGLFGSQEGVYHGVPLLGFPFYSDQHLNMNKAVLSGFGIKLHIHSITKEILRDSLMELIYNTSYAENTKKASLIFKDRPMTPLDTAMYWIEYVIRHRGTTHIRSAALDLKWYQVYLLDVIAFVISAVLVVCIIAILLLRAICGRKQKHPNKTKKH